jgi:putative restriction endonuclease
MARRANIDWTRDEHILAFNLYCQIPFGTIHMGNPRIIELAKLFGRSIGSVSYKLSNFARLDPALHARGIRGLSHGSKGEQEVWREFIDQPEALAFESERLLADRLGKSLEEVAEIDIRDLPLEGRDRDAVVRVRVNQSFFRRRILSAYEFRCCVTGIAIRDLLVASHIIPWATDVPNRLNPRNGLCLNALHDRAFDRGLMWVDDSFTIHFSPQINSIAPRSITSLDWLLSFEGKPLVLPKRFTPDPVLLGRHAERSANSLLST